MAATKTSTTARGTVYIAYRLTESGCSASKAREKAHGAQILACEGVLDGGQYGTEASGNDGVVRHGAQSILGLELRLVFRRHDGRYGRQCLGSSLAESR